MPGWPRPARFVGWPHAGLARGGPGAPKWGLKNMVLQRNGFQIGDYGISRDPNGLYGTQEAFGKASFPQNPFKKWFPSTFPYFGKFGEGPPGSEGLAILSTYLVEPLLLYWVGRIGPWWVPRL